MSALAVIDASVVLKWQLDDEEDVAFALALRDDFLLHGAIELHAPALLVYELTNAVRMAARRARLDEAVEQQALEQLLDAGIELHGPDPARVLATARRHGISGYDASYVTLASELDVDLWTGDLRLRNALDGKQPHVRPIADYPGTA